MAISRDCPLDPEIRLRFFQNLSQLELFHCSPLLFYVDPPASSTTAAKMDCPLKMNGKTCILPHHLIQCECSPRLKIGSEI